MDLSDDTVALLQQLGIEKADFLGYSMGGDVAMKIASHHPEIARKLVLAGGTSYNSWRSLRSWREIRSHSL